MALKKKITRDQLDKLSPILQDEYSMGEDGSFFLDVDGDDDLGALKRAKEHESTKRKEATKRSRELEARLKAYEDKEDADAEDLAKKNGDIASIEASWKTKNQKLKDSNAEKFSKLEGHLSTLLVDSVAQSIAKDISTSPKLLVPFLKQRLSADFEGDSPSTRVLDANGQISALSLDELKAEFQADPDFSAVLIASKASGGSSKTSEVGVGSSSGGGSQPLDLLSLSDADLSAHMTQLNEE